MKFVVRGLLVVGGLILVAFAAIGIMLATFNPNNYKPQIAEAVKKSTGRDLAINGDMKVVFYPVLGFEAQGVTLGNPAGFTEKEFLSVSDIQAGIKIMSLLQKKIEITKIRLDTPTITVIKQADGTNNLSFAKPDTAEKSAPADTGTDKTAAPKQDMQLSIDGIEIRNAKIISHDKKAGKTTTIDPMNLSLPGFTPGRSALFKLDMILSGDGLPPVKIDLSGDADVNTKTETAEISGFKLNANGTDLTGNFSVKGFKKPSVTFTVNANSLDLDTLMQRPAVAPVSSDDAIKSAAPRKAANDDKPLLPVDLLRTLTLKGDVSIGTLLFNGLTITDLKTKISASNGVIKADPLTMNFYEGAFASAMQIDVRGAAPAYNFTGDIKNLQVGGLVKAKAGDEYLTGLANSEFNLAFRGNTMRAIRSSADGDIKFNFGEGYINKWQLSKFINQAINYLETGSLGTLAEDRIKFTSMDLSLVGSNGVFRNNDLRLIAPKSHALGSGMIDLASQTVDYTIGVGQSDNPEKFAKKTRIPIRISGHFSAVSYKIDLQALAVDTINRKKDELIGKALEKLGGGKSETTPADGGAVQDNSPEAVGKELLKGLLGGGR